MRKGIVLLIVCLSVALVAIIRFAPSSPNTGHAPWRDGFASRTATILFVGDMMFDRTILAMSMEEGGDYLFSCIADYVRGFDLAVGNLEGPITGYPSMSWMTVPGDLGNTTFTFPTSTASLLARSGIDAVSLANNHIFDFGRQGVESTREHLPAAGVRYFGDPLDVRRKSALFDVNGLTVAIAGFNEFLGVDSVSTTVSEIGALRADADFVIVFSHWGEEYVPVVDRQRAAAHAFIEAGADAVIGAHPHVIQESEVYKGKQIYYSLGNFIFDQYWNEGVRKGLVLEAHLKDRSVSFVPRMVSSSRTSGPCLLPTGDNQGEIFDKGL